jgi:flavodoxin
MSTEIVRNLMERYDAGPAICNALGIDMIADPTCGDSWIQVSWRRQFCTRSRKEDTRLSIHTPSDSSFARTFVVSNQSHLAFGNARLCDQASVRILCRQSIAAHKCRLEERSSHSGVSTNLSENDRHSPVRRCNAPRVLIAYGSETGTAEAVARRLKRQLKTLIPVLMTLNEAEGLDVVVRRNITHVICIRSTFGMGKAPLNTAKFFETNITATKSTKFAVLALGSNIYPYFCMTGIQLDKKLSEAGLERAVTLTTVDAAGGADDTIEY